MHTSQTLTAHRPKDPRDQIVRRAQRLPSSMEISRRDLPKATTFVVDAFLVLDKIGSEIVPAGVQSCVQHGIPYMVVVIRLYVTTRRLDVTDFVPDSRKLKKNRVSTINSTVI